jgi:hypothetical protein
MVTQNVLTHSNKKKKHVITKRITAQETWQL